MKRLAVLVDWPDRFRFYRRLVPALREEGLDPLFVTNKLSLHRRARRHGIASRLTRRGGGGWRPDLRRSREVAAGYLSEGAARRLYGATRALLEAEHARDPLAGVWIWNGTGAAGRGARDFAAESGVASLFLELGNLPGRIFADPRGVNAESALAGDPGLLDGQPADLDSFRAWREAYLRDRLRVHPVPQAGILRRLDFAATARNWLGYRLLGVPADDGRSLARKLVLKLRARRLWPRGDSFDPEAGPYVFLPLQVSDDSQVLLNSPLDNEGAIRRAADVARDLGCRLAVKPHPAEESVRLASRVLALRRELGFSLVGGNTFRLLHAAERVVTLNSTAGLEARLAGRPVDFLGETFYRHLDGEARLASYVLSYLVELDYFGDGEADRGAVRRLLDRMR